MNRHVAAKVEYLEDEVDAINDHLDRLGAAKGSHESSGWVEWSVSYRLDRYLAELARPKDAS